MPMPQRRDTLKASDSTKGHICVLCWPCVLFLHMHVCNRWGKWLYVGAPCEHTSSTTDIIDSADSCRLWLSIAAGITLFGPLLVSCFP